MRFVKFILLSGCLLLSGCSLLGPMQTKPQHVYMIDTVPKHVAHRHKTGLTVLVNTPDSLPVFNTTNMAYTTNAYQLAYFSKSEWAMTPPQMLLPLMVQTLQNTHHFHAVTQAPSFSSYDYIVNSQIYELVQDFRYNPSLLRMVMRVQIVRAGTGRVVATKDFTAVVPAVVNAPYGGVLAANQATSDILQDFAAFCVRKM
jgi:cholesterol transport system auxiliary component